MLMSRCLLLTAASLPSLLPHESLCPLPAIGSSAACAGPPSICLPLGVTVGFTLRDDSVVFVLVQSPDQGILAAVQCTKNAGSAGAAGGPEGPEELAVLLVGEWCSQLLRLPALRASCAAPAQEHW